MVKFYEYSDLSAMIFVGHDVFSKHTIENFNIANSYAGCDAYTQLSLAVTKLLSRSKSMTWRKYPSRFGGASITDFEFSQETRPAAFDRDIDALQTVQFKPTHGKRPANVDIVASDADSEKETSSSNDGEEEVRHPWKASRA